MSQLDDYRYEELVQPPAKEPKAGHPLMAVHNLLRGRYRYAIPLALILAVPAGLLGYNLVPPLYRSTGSLRVRASLPSLVYPDLPENTVPAQFDALVGTLASRLQQQRLIDAAVQRPKMREAGWTAQSLSRAVRVERPRRTELIYLHVDNADAMKAKVAVESMLEEYMELFGADGEIGSTAKMQELDNKRREAESRLRTFYDHIASLQEEFGTEQGYSAKLYEELSKEQERNRILQNIAMLERQLGRDNEDPESTAEGEELPVEQLAQLDQVLAALIERRREVVLERRGLENEYGPRHDVMIDLARELDKLDAQIEDQARLARERMGSDTVDYRDGATTPAVRLRLLRDHLAVLEPAWEALSEEVAQLTRLRSAIATKMADAEDVQAERDDINEQLRKLRVERSNIASGRVSIESTGDLPLAPSTDRRLPLAVGCAGLGGMLGLGVFALVGLANRAYRFVDELDSEDLAVPLLGTLPILSPTDREADDVARLSIHHLRNLLQSQTADPRRAGGTVLTFTSPAAGDGKTSLTLALGMSYAVAGFKTIVVDADLVGRGLTRHLNLKGRPGLCDTVKAQRLNGEIISTAQANLEVLPAGREVISPENLSQEDINWLIRELRTRADVILVDTGPVLGSLEAALCATTADATVLVVSRGRRFEMAKAAVKRINLITGQCAGIIFNRANQEDIDRSSSVVSVSRASVRVLPPDESQQDDGGREPLISAILGEPNWTGSPELEQK